MKLIVCSIGVLVVTGVISLAIAPVLSLAQSTEPSDFSVSPGLSVLPGLSATVTLQDLWFQSDAEVRSALQAVLIPAQRMALETASTRDASREKTLIALNLSPLQQTELMQILLLNQSPPADVLTPIEIEQVRRSLPFHP